VRQLYYVTSHSCLRAVARVSEISTAEEKEDAEGIRRGAAKRRRGGERIRIQARCVFDWFVFGPSRPCARAGSAGRPRRIALSARAPRSPWSLRWKRLRVLRGGYSSWSSC